MRRLGSEHGFAVTTIEQVADDDGLAPFSSSAIRDDLRHGRVEEAARALGYWWMLSGNVVPGDARGRGLGFPTANLLLDPGVEPLEGIYAARVSVSGSLHHAAAYIGSRPTFNASRRFLEVFIFDFDRDIYGQFIDVQFVGLIRRDMKFATSDELVSRMQADCEAASLLLRAVEKNDPIKKFSLGRMQAEGSL
jgi:riboflavin kinase/FMN adenylyltransferase